MRERGVSEVVERPERLRDSCTGQRRSEVLACEARRIERSPFLRVAEDEFVVALERAAAPVLGEQLVRSRA